MSDRPNTIFLAVCKALSRCHDRWLQRQTLAELDPHLLNDIGISRADADRECAKPFWHSQSTQVRNTDASTQIETLRHANAIVSGDIKGDEQ